MEKSFFELDQLTKHSRTWAMVNESYLTHNIEQIKAKLPDATKVMAVVKADGYGHGDVRVAKIMLVNGVDFLAVSNIDEALSLRNNNMLDLFDYEVLILGYTPVGYARVLYDNNIQQTIISSEYGELLNEECEKNDIKIKAHIKIDTGMSRVGINFDNVDEITSVYKMKNLQVKGVYTHLSSADGLDDGSVEYTKLQKDRFDTLINKISKLDVKIGLTHLQNSAGAMTINSDSDYDYARVGLLLYGISPIDVDKSSDRYVDVKPAMSLHSVVAMVKEIDSNIAVSYGRHFVSDKVMKIATIPIGYADGYPRAMSGKGKVLINGSFAPIVGNVCMDQIMVDVTNIDVKFGDLVTLVGRDGENAITWDDVAQLVGTIPYELVCLVGKRVPRETVG